MAVPAEILLINVDYVKKLTAINQAVDDNFIKAAMYIAQDKWIQPYLGDDLMAKLKADTDAGTIANPYLLLRDTYCAKAIVWWTAVELLPYLTYKIDNGTLVQRISEDSQPVTDQVSKDMIDRARTNAQYYTQRIIDYLCANSASFPEYSSNAWPERSPRTNVKGAMVFSISDGNTASSRTGNTNIRLSQIP